MAHTQKPKPMVSPPSIHVCLLLCCLLCGCVTVEKGERGPSGTNEMRVVARVTGFGKNAELEENNVVTLSAPYITFTRPDGMVIGASNAVVTFSAYSRIGGESTIPSGINAGANVIGAGAELAGAGRP